MAGICTSPYPSPYPIEKVGNSPYPYPLNAGIPRQNGDEFGQYPRDGFICYLYSQVISQLFVFYDHSVAFKLTFNFIFIQFLWEVGMYKRIFFLIRILFLFSVSFFKNYEFQLL